MTKIIGWKPNNDNTAIILKCLNDVQEPVEIELAVDIYKEILKSGPPNEVKMMRDLIDQIHQVRINRVLNVESVDKELAEIDKKEKEVMGLLEKAETAIEVKKYGAMLRSLAGRRASCSQRRHLVKLLHQEEGQLSTELLKKL